MIVTWSRGTADHNMPEELLVALGDCTRAHPWWQARAALTVALLRRIGVPPRARLLDAGCGWGVTLEAVARHGYDADGMDISRRVLERLDQPGRRLIEADIEQELREVVDPYDAVLALDVLEHLDDDRGAIRRLLGLVRLGGWLIVSVPALPELYSEFDAVQGHRRRYVPETLRAAFDGAPISSLTTFWWGAWMVPLLRRRMRRRPPAVAPGPDTSDVADSLQTYRRYLRLPSWPGPSFMRLAFACEEKLAVSQRLSIGTSLFAFARKEAAPAPGSASR